MREIRINKGNGRVRIVYAPTNEQKKSLKKLLPKIMAAERKAAAMLGVEDVAHGFIEGRSPVSCAKRHCGFRTTISVDLAGWFDSVTQEQVQLALVYTSIKEADAARLASELCHKGAPRQGLPTSPAAANLVGAFLDEKLLTRLKYVFGKARFAFTRYADDITISCDVPRNDYIVDQVMGCIKQSVTDMGWAIAEHKTCIQESIKGRRRNIVGVAVDESVHGPLYSRRKLRAALFNAQKHAGREKGRKAACSARGLTEWCSMKLPNAMRASRRIAGQGENSGQAKGSSGEAEEKKSSGRGRRMTFGE